MDVYCAKHTKGHGKRQAVMFAMTLENRFQTPSQVSMLPLMLGVSIPLVSLVNLNPFKCNNTQTCKWRQRIDFFVT